MAKATTINIKTDVETKKAIEALYSAFGLSVSEAVNIFFKKSLMTYGLPFELKIPQYNEETLEALKEVQEIKMNPHLYKKYDNFEDLFRDLYSDDEV